MALSASDIDRIEGQFDHFCKRVLQNKARDLRKAKEHRQKKEVLFSELSGELHTEFVAMNETSLIEKHSFLEFGKQVSVESDELAQALRRLPERKRKIILLSYFFDMTDQEIGKLLHSVRSSIQAARSRTLKEMRDMIEGKK